mgnify:CR=1 FL=1
MERSKRLKPNPTKSKKCSHKDNEKKNHTNVLTEFSKKYPQVLIPIFSEALLSSNANFKKLVLQEIMVIGKTKPDFMMTVLENSLKKYYPYSIRYEPSRLLITLGRDIPKEIQEVLKLGLLSNELETRLTAVYELMELMEIAPKTFAIFLSTMLKRNDIAGLHWLLVLALMKLVKKNKKNFMRIVRPLFLDKTLQILCKKQCTHQKKNSQKKNRNMSVAHQNAPLPDDWMTILELIDLAKISPQAALPLLIKSLGSKDTHLQWLSALGLASIQYNTANSRLPANVWPEQSEQYSGTKVLPVNRLLIQLGKRHIKSCIPIFSQALLSNNTNLQMMALYELIAACQNNPQRLLAMLKQIFLARQVSDRLTLKRLLAEVNKTTPKIVTKLLRLVSKDNHK